MLTGMDQSHLATMATKMSTSSAMNPALLLCLIVCPLAFLSAASLFHFDHVFAASLLILIGCWPLGIAGWQLIRFTTHAPDRLQREQHVERMLQIRSQLSVKGIDGIRDIPIHSELSNNPQLEDKTVE